MATLVKHISSMSLDAKQADIRAFFPPEPAYKTVSGDLGGGTFSHIYQATRRNHGNALYCLKQARMHPGNKTKTMNAQDTLERERKALEELRHPNIISMIETTVVDGHKMLVFPWYDCGDLLDFYALDATPGHIRFPKECELKSIIRGIAHALQHIHKKKRVHGDVKPENVLVKHVSESNQVMDVVLADFGHSKTLEEISLTPKGRRGTGTPEYMSPEYRKTHVNSRQCDMWALGVLIYGLVEGRFPYETEGRHRDLILQDMEEIRYDRQAWKQYSWKLQCLVQGLLRFDATERFDADDVLFDPWLQ